MMMKMNKKVVAIAAATAILTSMGANLVSASFATDTPVKDSNFTVWKENEWINERGNSGRIVLTPGKTAADLNFAWYSQSKGAPAVKLATDAAMTQNVEVFSGTACAIDRTNGVETYQASNKVTAKGAIAPNTTYYYSYTDDLASGNWSEPVRYQSKGTESYQMIYVGDPQVGASGSDGQNTIDDKNIAYDTYNWNKTLTKAAQIAPNASFILSAGDQIDYSNANNNAVREREYAGFLYPSLLRSLPLATTIGNHESRGDDYSLHYNNPNTEANLGATASGSDYYFSYGDALYISLNSNNRNVGEHAKLMQQAIDSHPDAKWKIVMFHHDIYGSGAPHSDIDGANLRILFAPLMDQFNIDVCLTGHDHSYARTFQILDGKVVDYGDGDQITDPDGTMYLSAGSASGSKFYELNKVQQYFIAERNNTQLPTFSTIDLTPNTFTIRTYDYEGNQYAEDFTIVKNVDGTSMVGLMDEAAGMDGSLYTKPSFDRVDNALQAAHALLETEKDGYPAELTENYDASNQGNNPNDPLDYYGYAQGEYAAEGSKKLKEGYSNFLDKTMDNDQQAISAEALADAYATLSTAMQDVVKTDDAEALAAAIDGAKKLLEAAEEGTGKGQYAIGSKAVLQSAVQKAAGILDSEKSTGAQVKSAIQELETAVQTFEDGKITEEAKPSDPSTPADPEKPNKPGASVPNTGDPSSLAGIVTAAVTALAATGGLAGIAVKRRRTK